MANSVRFACTSLVGVNKVGKLKQDENGYYPMVVGALNVFNSAGELYVYEQARDLFEQSSQLMRRVSRGALRGEYGHPKFEPGMSSAQFVNRLMAIYEDKVCCHHKEIILDFDNIKDEHGNPIIGIISKVLPSGPYGQYLEKSLNNKDENVCFSIRAFTDDSFVRGVNRRVLKTIVTWDMVNEPGISAAEKFKAPALESHKDDEKFFTRNDFERAIKETKAAGVATESVMLTAGELFASMGWNVSKDVLAKPSFMNW